MQQREEPRALAHDRLALEIAADPSAIRLARLFAASVARHAACDEDDVEDLKVAISEACTNAVKAHREAGAEAPIVVTAHPQSERVVFEVVDARPGAELPPPVARSDALATGLDEGSLGLSLIRALFSDTEIERNSDGGFTVRFSVTAGAPDDE